MESPERADCTLRDQGENRIFCSTLVGLVKARKFLKWHAALCLQRMET